MSDKGDSVKTLTLIVLVCLWIATLIGWAIVFGVLFFLLLKSEYLYGAVAFIPLLSQTLVVFAGWDEVVSVFGRWSRNR
jgi:hypothetical protein